jgi:hypothetical protein
MKTQLVAGGRIFYRDASGVAQIASRSELPQLAGTGVVRDTTPVFDTTITSARNYRASFERPARDSWVAALLQSHASQSSSRSATNSSSLRNG